MSMKRRNRRRQIRTRKGSIASCAKRKCSPSQHDEHSLDGQIKGYSGSDLPEDIWCHILSLMPIQDAARVACVSHTFLRSWRCRPNLDFSRETLGLINACRNEETQRNITSIVDHILQNHSGIGVKAVKFQDDSYYNIQDLCHLDLEDDSFYDNQDFCHLDLDRWLRNTIKPGIEELNISLHGKNTMYNFPCSLLSDEIGESLRNLHLVGCYFHPTIGLGSLRNLRRIQLCNVSITESQLECLLSNSFSLEQLVLRNCGGIICLKIPCLQRLSYLEVNSCSRLEVIESKAPNLSSVRIADYLHVQLSLLETSRIKKYFRSCPGAAFYARTELPSSMPNLESLSLSSATETINTPLMPSKFLHLKFLTIALRGQTYDCFSLLSFFDASPFLETFILNVLSSVHVKPASVFEDPSDLRKMPENHNDKLKCVRIINFSSAKSLIELTCHILESAMSLECLTLDTTHGAPRCSVTKHGRCWRMTRDEIMEAHRALLAVQTYVKSKVPSTVELNVLEPCSQCHAVAL